MVLEPALSGFETKNWPALREAPSSSICAGINLELARAVRSACQLQHNNM